VGSRVYPVGRLDYASEGLLLMTNDGTLAHRLMKAAAHVAKTYVVKVSGQPREDAIARLRGGLSIATDDGKRVRTSPAKIRIVKEAANPWYEITLIEGRNRQIRRMLRKSDITWRRSSASNMVRSRSMFPGKVSPPDHAGS